MIRRISPASVVRSEHGRFLFLAAGLNGYYLRLRLKVHSACCSLERKLGGVTGNSWFLGAPGLILAMSGILLSLSLARMHTMLSAAKRTYVSHIPLDPASSKSRQRWIAVSFDIVSSESL